MVRRQLEHLLQQVEGLFARPASGEQTDRQLLACFARQRDETAFAALVRRHGPLVLGVSRRILQHDQDAEDVFQAAFLILARKAASVRWQSSIAGWLYCVAYRLALRTRARNARQRDREQEAATASAMADTARDNRSELFTLMDDELRRLTDQYREPLLLCYLEGKTRDQAAQQLGWSLRTLERRLHQGLKLLRTRLARRGVELPMALLTAGLSQQAASAAISTTTVASTVEAALGFRLHTPTLGGAMSSRVAALAEGGIKAMAVKRLTISAVVLVTASLLVAGIAAVGHRLLARERPDEKRVVETEPSQPPPLVWPEGTVVKGRVVDHKGVAVANAEVLLLGKERILVDADQRTWFVPEVPVKDRPGLPSARTNKDGEFSLEQKKGTADRLAVIANDPLFWVVARKDLARGDNVEIKLPASGKLTIQCDLPGKDAKQPVMIHLKSLDGVSWDRDILRFHEVSYSVTNPGERTFGHLPPGHYAVERTQETKTDKDTVLMTNTDRQVAKVDPDRSATIRFERKVGRPLTGQVRGLEKVDLRYAYVQIMYPGPEETYRDGKRARPFTAFDVIPIKSDGRFTTDPIPPGKYDLFLFAVGAETLRHSNQDSDFSAQVRFTVPEQGEMPKVEVIARAEGSKDRAPNTDYRVRVVDEAGKPVAAPQAAATHSGQVGFRWNDGIRGIVGLGGPYLFRDAKTLDVLVRADGYAPAVARFRADQFQKLQQGEATVTLQQGQRVELRFRLPEGLGWPRGVLPDVYFSDFQSDVSTMRQPANRRNPERIPDFNMVKLRELGDGRFELRLAQDTPPFFVGIHAPGFLQFFDCGPFTLADVKQGTLAIDVPRPAALDIQFDPATSKPESLPFQGVNLMVMRQLQGDSYVTVASDAASSTRHQLRLTDLAPGSYTIWLGTQPKPESKPLPGTEINLGSFRDQRKLVLEAGKTEKVPFHYVPFDPNAARGQRTAVLRLRLPDGSPAKGRKVKVEYYDGHYGSLVVFSGTVPDSGEIKLRGITDRVTRSPAEHHYYVTVGSERLGSFGFTPDKPEPVFDFHLPAQVGDLAPDVELHNIATGKTIRLSSLRGKVVCLEFWATWCGPCQGAMAKLSQLAEEQGPGWKDRVAIVPLSIDATAELVKSHVGKRGWDRLEHYWVGEADKGFKASPARAFVISGVPEAILIGPDGRIRWRGHPVGATEGMEIKMRIEAELKKGVPAP